MARDIVANVTGLASLTRRFSAISKRIDQNMYRALASAALLVESDAKASIQSNSPGSQRKKRYRPFRLAIVSSAGHPPNTDLGGLVRSVNHFIGRSRLGLINAFVGTGLKYGRWLEEGTRDMKPRPWLLPALRRNKTKIAKLMRSAALKGLTK